MYYISTLIVKSTMFSGGRPLSSANPARDPGSTRNAMRLLLLCICISAAAVTASPHTCSPPTPPHLPCPPFRSPPTAFPFALSPGCGHPSFQIRCSSPHSLISINSHYFHLLDLPLPRNSLLLAPAIDGASCSALPAAPIELSATPFRLVGDICTHLSALRPCLPTSPPANCSHWQLRLLSQPTLLFPGCAGVGVAAPRRCDPDVPATLSSLLSAGVRVEWDPADDPYFANCSACRSAVGGLCGFNDTAPTKPFLCFPSPSFVHDHSLRTSRLHSPAARIVILTTSFLAAACLVILLLSFYFAAALRRRRDGLQSGTTTAAFLRRHQLRPPVFTFDQLRTSTGNFDPRRKIGDGGFGSVYLAQLPDGRSAAVKRLHRRHPAATTKSFCNEILILSALRHPNLVRLHGYCCDPRGLLLVYDYVPNGSLAEHLHGSRRRPALTWTVRVNIAFQTAAALEYLHFGVKPPVVHRDVTTCNIFVERDMRIKLGDFGLSRLLSLPDPAGGLGSSEYVCCTGPQGTPGYLDPDYHRSFRLTEKSDVYSFGVVLLELMTGMKAVDLKREKRDVALVDLVVSRIQVGKLRQVVDESIGEGAVVMGTVEAVAELAFRCVAEDKDDRPDAREIVEELRRIREVLNSGCV